ncbi:MAG: hypothetical protein CM1200mP6_05640 [Anaerolineaceae bacterium]|nr:MAG: hypothetical protein CM1200mP6_05640 [Anaerolineaceae bacterium]
MSDNKAKRLLETAEKLRWDVGSTFHEGVVESIYADAAHIAEFVLLIKRKKRSYFDLDRTIDRLVTSRLFGFPLMVLMLTVVFWMTISGANVPSSMLATLLLDNLYPLLKTGASTIGLPWWLDGLLIDGIYLAMGWVISVMLPPMAIFFPLFTLLEDLGYLPRVAFNLDNMFSPKWCAWKTSTEYGYGMGM